MGIKTYGSITISKLEQLYTWIKFADDAHGANMDNNPSGKSYMGIGHNKNSAEESDDPSEYTWTLIKGQDTMTCYIDSSAGTSFEHNQTGDTALMAYLYEGNHEVDQEARFTYTWYATNKDNTADVELGTGKTLTVKIQDIIGKGVYFIADDGDLENTSVLYLARVGIMVLNKGV